MTVLPPVRVEEHNIEKRLAELGLSKALLISAISAGVIARSGLTPHHPRVHHGITTWAETTAALRQVLIPLGWLSDSTANFERVLHESYGIGIVVMNGDEGTGLHYMTPSNKCPKGALLSGAIAENNRQSDFFPDLLEQCIQAQRATLPLWVLLVHFSDKEVRAELSMPIGSCGKQIEDWAERIILPSIPLDGDRVSVDNPLPPPPDIDVEIQWKPKA